MTKHLIPILLLTLCCLQGISAQDRKDVNYDENKVPKYELPALLQMQNGEKVTDRETWEKKRRPELLALFTEQMFGKMPEGKVKVKYRTLEQTDDALDGKAIRKQVEFTFSGKGLTRKALLLLFFPKSTEKVPMFLHFNFQGNHSISNDTAILPSQHSTYPRGHQTHRWPIQKIIDAGYGLATVHYDDFFPDNKDRFAESIFPLFGIHSADELPADGGQAIAAWAWGYSRMMDYLEKEPLVDKKRVMLMGHSRLGKTSLWAGVCDERFAIVSANDAGCGGDALSRRRFGETLKIMNETFPHWFCKNFRQYNGNEDALPFDQHQLLALVAPRPLYTASAEEDRWADPKGQFLSAALTEEVYALYGMKGLDTMVMPSVHQPIMNRVGYHIRTGIHDVTDYDWDCYIRFADKWLK